MTSVFILTLAKSGERKSGRQWKLTQKPVFQDAMGSDYNFKTSASQITKCRHSEPRKSTCVPSRLGVLTEALGTAWWHPWLLDYATLLRDPLWLNRKKERKDCVMICETLWVLAEPAELVCEFVFGWYLGASIPKMSNRQGLGPPTHTPPHFEGGNQGGKAKWMVRATSSSLSVS